MKGLIHIHVSIHIHIHIRMSILQQTLEPGIFVLFCLFITWLHWVLAVACGILRILICGVVEGGVSISLTRD